MKAGRVPEALEMLWMPCLDTKLSGENRIWLNQCTEEKLNNPVHVLIVFKFGLY